MQLCYRYLHFSIVTAKVLFTHKVLLQYSTSKNPNMIAVKQTYTVIVVFA